MIKKHYYSWQDVENACVNIALQMYKDNWRPDYIVGITKGGNVPATILCNMLGVRGEALKVSLRDDDMGPESNLWMAEDAFGYVPAEEQEVLKCRWDLNKRKKILVVDDINDTGATFNWIKQDWMSSCFPHEDNAWNSVWNGDTANVRFAVITENLSSTFDSVRYSVHEVNKAEEDVWLVYPWENVGEY
jgi:hypoxanthine phosphoribosyltransferase